MVDAKASLAGDFEGADVILDLADMLAAGKPETCHQPVATSGGKSCRPLDGLHASLANAGHDHAAFNAGSGPGLLDPFA